MGNTVAVWEAEVPHAPQQVWQVVTDLMNWQWRSDLSSCEIVDERRFIEIPKKGKPIRFCTTRLEECRIWEFHMDSPSLTGIWKGTFEPTENGGCRVRFVENVCFRQRLVPNWVVKRFLTAYQARYFRDLRAELQSRFS